MIRFCRVALALVLVTLVLQNTAAAQDDGWRSIEFETTEVTEVDVVVSPDGQWLIFTILGHLFHLPVEGGDAEQLTFGPYYDSDPLFSPDGSRVAFVSDRDGSEGNIFVLELATGEITQVTYEAWAGRPAWSPDGEAIAYLRFVREAGGRLEAVGWEPMPAQVGRVSLGGGKPETISTPPRLFRSVFYLPDGRLGWAVVEREQGSPHATTRFEVMSPQGTVSTLRTLEGVARRAAASPAGDGLYIRRSIEFSTSLHPWAEDLLFLPLPEGAERLVVMLPPHESPRFSVATDNESLYLSEAGRLWKIALPSGLGEPIAFRARVRLEIQDPVAPPKLALTVGSSAPVRSVLSPRLSPDGGHLVFGAFGYLWQQPLDGSSPAQRLFEGSAIERNPAFSPDGRQLAFVHSEHGEEQVKVFDFASRQTRTVASGKWQPSWSPDGQRLVFAEHQSPNFSVVTVNLSDGKQEQLAETARWFPRPHFSADGESLYYSSNEPNGTGTLYRLPLKEKAKAEPITQLVHRLSDGLVSTDGQWLVFRRNTEIWVARLGNEPVKEEDVRQLSPEGGDTFAFTPDGSAVIYAVGNRVWRHPLTGGEAEEIAIRLNFQRRTPPPLLVRRVRVLDFLSGGFGGETSLFIEEGRIRWIGSEDGRQLPQQIMTVDAAGRFAIPGLFDFHAHTWHGNWVGNQNAFLAYGVTSIRDPGGALIWMNALADRSEATSDPVPRYFYSGEIFEGRPHAGGDLSVLIDHEDDARTYVRRWKEWGAQFIKSYPTLPWPLKRKVAEEARRLSLPMVGHGTNVEEVTKSVILGYTVLEHMGDNPYHDDVLQMLAAAGTRWDPTLAQMGGNALLLHAEPERVADAKFRTFAHSPSFRKGQTGLCVKHLNYNGRLGLWIGQLASIRAAHRLGIKLQVGTDATQTCVFYGSSLHWELEYFVQAGIPPLEVLRMATQEAAAGVGADEDLGTLEVGKLADIVLLDANPLEDIKNTQTIWRVIKGGWVFDPEALRPERN